MGAGNLVLAFDTPENREVLDGTGFLFSNEVELTDRLARVVADPWSSDHASLRAAARRRAESVYSWEAVTAAYEELFERLVRRRRGR